MKVFITGATGWLGSRFVENLVKSKTDWEINCLVLPGDKNTFLNKLSEAKKINIVSGDITVRSSLKGFLKGMDIVFHTAGIIHPKKIKELYRVNTIGTLNLALEAQEAGVKRFIYISSNSVAGINSKKHKLLTEDMEPKPYFNYGLSKYYAENIVNSFKEAGKMETVIIRPCWFYGPNQPERQTTFFKMIKNGSPIIFGSGLNFRSMSYIDNVCQAMLLAAEKKEAKGETYWIADARPYTTKEIYETIADLLEVRNFRPKYLPDFVSETFYLIDKVIQFFGLYVKEFHVAGEMNKDIACSNEKAIKELGYTPNDSLKEGMKESIQWCKERGLI